MIGVRDATDGYKQIGEFPAHGMEPHDIALLADGRTMVIANGGIQTHPDRGDDELNIPDMQPSLVYVDVDDRRSPRGASPCAWTASALDPPSCHRGRRYHRVRLPISRPRGGRAGAGRLSPPRRDAGRSRGAWARRRSACSNYIGSVAADADGAIVAASAPKGGLVTYWDVAGAALSRRLRPE